MEDSTTTTPSPDERDATLLRKVKVDLLPRILITTYYHARLIFVNEKEWIFWVFLPKEPIESVSSLSAKW